MFWFVSCISAGPAEYHADSWMFRFSLSHLPPTDRLDSSCPPLSCGSRGTLWLIPPQTVASGSRTGDVVLSFHSEMLVFTRGCKIRTAVTQNAGDISKKKMSLRKWSLYAVLTSAFNYKKVYLQLLLDTYLVWADTQTERCVYVNACIVRHIIVSPNK